MGNKIGSLPAMLEGHLQDFAQFWQDIDYSDIGDFGNKSEEEWDKAYKLLIKLDKDGFFEEDTDMNPHKYMTYTKLIKLVRNDNLPRNSFYTS